MSQCKKEREKGGCKEENKTLKTEIIKFSKSAFQGKEINFLPDWTEILQTEVREPCSNPIKGDPHTDELMSGEYLVLIPPTG